MFIGDYPAIQYGSVLYIVQHNRQFRVIVVKQSRYSDSKETINLHGKSDYSYQTTQFYVNTSEAEMKCVLDKIRSCCNFREANVYYHDGDKKQLHIPFHGSDAKSWLHAIYFAEPNDKMELICDY